MRRLHVLRDLPRAVLLRCDQHARARRDGGDQLEKCMGGRALHGDVPKRTRLR